MAARKLRGEADHLNGRVVVTENRIEKLKDLAKKDDSLTDEAKEKVICLSYSINFLMISWTPQQVGQAKADSFEAGNQVDKAMKEVNTIIEELKNLRDINVDDLDTLGKSLLSISKQYTVRKNSKQKKRLENKKQLYGCSFLLHIIFVRSCFSGYIIFLVSLPSRNVWNILVSFLVLEKRLSAAEEEVRRAKLADRLDSLIEIKNLQNQWIKKYQSDIGQLEMEVGNIKAIADALPEGCFRRSRLEP